MGEKKIVKGRRAGRSAVREHGSNEESGRDSRRWNDHRMEGSDHSHWKGRRSNNTVGKKTRERVTIAFRFARGMEKNVKESWKNTSDQN